jgi:hypothetical protein
MLLVTYLLCSLLKSTLMLSKEKSAFMNPRKIRTGDARELMTRATNISVTGSMTAMPADRQSEMKSAI